MLLTLYPTNVITTFKRSKNLQKQNTYYSFSNIDTFLCSMCVVVCFNIFLFKNIYTKKIKTYFYIHKKGIFYIYIFL